MYYNMTFNEELHLKNKSVEERNNYKSKSHVPSKLKIQPSNNPNLLQSTNIKDRSTCNDFPNRMEV